MDADGCVWNAQWGGWRVVRYRPDGSVDRIVQMPVEQPTSCCFGGANLDVLFVTSARNGLDREALEQSPLSGSVFALSGVGRGMPVPPMAWNGEA